MKPPAIADLFQRYLQGQAEAQSQGLGFAETLGDVVPHEAVAVQPIDPKQAWDDALQVLKCFPGLPKTHFSVPPDWPALVSGQESAVALAFCLGNTPQLVRNVQPLLDARDPAGLRGAVGRDEIAPALDAWARGSSDGASRLLAAGVLRLARHFTEAAKILNAGIDKPWQAVHANEEAALAWHQGKAAEAAALWNKQVASPAVLFNRGMAALFMGDPAAARASLTPAVETLPETSPWYHLGRLYLTLAEGR